MSIHFHGGNLNKSSVQLLKGLGHHVDFKYFDKKINRFIPK
jgi:hypothetical protein